MMNGPVACDVRVGTKLGQIRPKWDKLPSFRHVVDKSVDFLRLVSMLQFSTFLLGSEADDVKKVSDLLGPM